MWRPLCLRVLDSYCYLSNQNARTQLVSVGHVTNKKNLPVAFTTPIRYVVDSWLSSECPSSTAYSLDSCYDAFKYDMLRIYTVFEVRKHIRSVHFLSDRHVVVTFHMFTRFECTAYPSSCLRHYYQI